MESPPGADEADDGDTLLVAAARAGRAGGPATAVLPSSSVVVAGKSTERVGSSTTATTTMPLAALEAEEIERTRTFAKMMAGLGLVGIAAVANPGGDPTAKAALCAAIVVTVVGMGTVLVKLRNPANFTSALLTVTGLLAVLSALATVHYWGVLSPAAAMVLFGIYFFSLGQFGNSVLVLFLVCSLGHAIMAALVVSGIVPELGVVQSTYLPLHEQIIGQAMVQVGYGCAFYFGRRSRKATLGAVERLDRAVRAVSVREALLAEARQELERALELGGPGRYTGQEVGAYRLGMLIGRGGMGEVYEGVNVHDGREAAVKLLHPTTLADPTAVARFVREAQIAARLDSPNLVAVYEVGLTTGDIPFIAMERLRGIDLAGHLRSARRMPLDEVVELTRSLAGALSVAHAANVIHRDLKPHNVFRAQSGDRHVWRLLDFGVSKWSDHATSIGGRLIGTPAYMSPEQARSEDVDARTDIYALAAIVYRCLTGYAAFTGKDIPATLFAVVHKMPTQPSQLVTLPRDVDAVLAVALAKNREHRFARVAELADALAAAASSRLDERIRERAAALTSATPWSKRHPGPDFI